MEYKKYDLLSYKLHMIKTNKFKTVTVKIIFSNIVKKEEVTIKNFLSDMLVYSNGVYKTHKEFSEALQDLYAADISSSCYRVGRLYNTKITMSFLNEKYTEKGMFEKSLSFLSDVIFKPNVNNDSFDSDSFNITYETSKSQIESIKEDIKKLSLIRMLETMGKDEEFSIHGYGYMDDLEKINTKNLYNTYLELLKNSKVDIFIIGDIDYNNTKNIITKLFKFNTLKKEKKEFIINHKSFRRIPKSKIEPMSISQSKLSIGCKIEDLSEFERNYVLSLYNIILGGGCDSKFFKNIREKNSLCYYISSSVNKLDNMLLIVSGITKNNYDKVIKLIKEEMKNMSKSNITQDEVDKAKTMYKTLLDELQDSPSKLISMYYSMELFNFDDIEVRKKMIDKVTINDIKNVSSKIHMDTIYLLGGDL